MSLSDTITEWAEEYLSLRLSEYEHVEVVRGYLPTYLAWAPIADDPVIEDVLTGVTLTAEEDYIWDWDGRIILLTAQPQSIWRLTYTAGDWSQSPWGEIPDGLSDALTALDTSLSLDAGLYESETLGDYSYTLGTVFAAYAPSSLSTVRQYKRTIV